MIEKSCVLVVEDEPDLRDLLVEVLRDENFEVREAANVSDAKKLLENPGTFPNKIHCVLADYFLGGPTGLDLIQWVRTQSQTLPHLKDLVFALSASEGAPREEELKKRGANHVFYKPIDFKTFPAWVRGLK